MIYENNKFQMLLKFSHTYQFHIIIKTLLLIIF